MIPEFRVWHKKAKKMYEVFSIHFGLKYVGVYESGKDWNKDYKFFKFVDVIFMQSARLKDKNGKEIFEGDIFKHDKTSEGKDILYKVFRDEKTGQFKWEQIEPCLVASFEAKDVEVIGNIHENPELLEAKK